MRNIGSYIFLLFLFCSCGSKPHADLLLMNGKVYTVDSTFSTAEAFAVKNGKVIAVGTNDDIKSQFTADSIIDAQGRAVYPGFIDAHAHFVGYGRGLYEVGLYDCKDWTEVVERVKRFAQEHPDEPWIRGRGWDQNLWPGKAFPDNALLNELFPDRPVLLQRIDGHAGIANAKALQMASVSPGQQLPGGQVEVKNGKLDRCAYRQCGRPRSKNNPPAI
jgi:predicted amidohydrolase YtcJ